MFIFWSTMSADSLSVCVTLKHLSDSCKLCYSMVCFNADTCTTLSGVFWIVAPPTALGVDEMHEIIGS